MREHGTFCPHFFYLKSDYFRIEMSVMGPASASQPALKSDYFRIEIQIALSLAGSHPDA